jgi:site-specific DNA recombinase
MKVAIYARVSSDEQAERNTVQGQLDYLRDRCRLEQVEVFGEYIDEGISGTVAFDQRPGGARLLVDAKAKKFSMVLVYRIDRLARSLEALLATEKLLTGLNVALKSATEDNSTTTPNGRLVFHLLGSLAEREKATIAERTQMGRQRIVRAGRWAGGAVPFGYAVEGGKLVPSAHRVDAAGCSEAELMQAIFTRVADGHSLLAECARLNNLGVPSTKRFSSGRVVVAGIRWRPGPLSELLHNTAYIGRHVYHSKRGAITQEVPPLVDRTLWDQAHAQLKRNLSRPKAKGEVNLLRVLVKCTGCGSTFVGAVLKRGVRYYRCSNQQPAAQPDPAQRCRAMYLRADTIEGLVWTECRRILGNPEAIVRAAQDEVDYRMAILGTSNEQRARLQREIGVKEAAAQQIIALIADRKITYEAASGKLDEINKEKADLHAHLEAVDSQHELARVFLARVHVMKQKAYDYWSRLDVIEADPEAKREVIETMINRVAVTTIGQRNRKNGSFVIHWQVLPPYVHPPSRTLSYLGTLR